MKVSIIIPLYNKAPYVTKALESIASQTFTDWECIIVNDGSTDNSFEVVDVWLKENIDEHWRSIGGHWRLITQENAGVSAARNHGISLSTGDYVCFLDADDWWAPTFLEEMMKFAEEYPDAGLYASNYWYVRHGKEKLGVSTQEHGYINYPRMYYTTGNMPVWTGAVLIPRVKIKEVKGKNGEVFPVGIKLGEDFLLWSKIMLRYRVAFCNKPLAYYNNDVLTTLRLTRNLHVPECNMLWHLDDITNQLMLITNAEQKRDWKIFLDWLRVNGLMEYWLDKRYREAVARELEKINQCLLLNAACAGNIGDVLIYYKKPIWFVKLQREVKRVGSFCKNKIKK